MSLTRLQARALERLRHGPVAAEHADYASFAWLERHGYAEREGARTFRVTPRGLAWLRGDEITDPSPRPSPAALPSQAPRSRGYWRHCPGCWCELPVGRLVYCLQDGCPANDKTWEE